MSNNSNDHFIELLFATLFATFFASRLSALEFIGLTLGTNWDSCLIFIGHNIIFIFVFYRTKAFFSSGERGNLVKILYHVIIICQTLSPYSALQVAWWYEYTIYELNRGLISNPETFPIPIIVVYTLLIAILPVFLSVYIDYANERKKHTE